MLAKHGGKNKPTKIKEDDKLKRANKRKRDMVIFYIRKKKEGKVPKKGLFYGAWEKPLNPVAGDL